MEKENYRINPSMWRSNPILFSLALLITDAMVVSTSPGSPL